MTVKIIKEISGHYTFYKNELGQFNSINDKPSVSKKNGFKWWHKNGKRHRTKGPAIINVYNNEYWYYEDNDITNKVHQLMEEEKISSDWENWTEEDEFLFVLLVS